MSNAFSIHKITSILLALTLVVVPFCSFADDESAADPVQGSAPLSFTLEEWEFISQASDDEDRQIRQSAVLASTASTYDIDDIYSILSSVRTIDNSRYVWATYDESVWSEVHNVYNKLITNSYNNTYYSVSELVAQLLSMFSSFTSNFYSPIYGSASLWQLTDDIKTFVGLGLFDSQANSYLDLINSKIGTLSSSMTSGFNAVLTSQGHIISSVDSTTNAVNNTTNAVNNTTNAVNNTTNAVNNTTNSVNNVYDKLDDIYDELFTTRDIEVRELFNYYSTASVPYTAYSYPALINQSSVGQEYLRVFIPRMSALEFDVFYEFDSNIVSLSQSSYSGTQSYVSNDLVSISYQANQHTCTLDFNNNILHVHYSRNSVPDFDYVAYQIKCTVHLAGPISYVNNPYMLSTSSENVHLLTEYYNYLKHIDDDIHIFKELYASDDIIAAKENQQPFEDSVLSDFTGSGSASAKVADAVDVKGVQGQVLGALGSSASASDLTTIFNTSNPGSDNSFFSFFTQRVYNDLNNVQSTRGAVPEDDIYINLLDQRNDDYINLLGGSW